MTKVLIIGGGFAGCAVAHLLTRSTKPIDITLIESASELGGGVRTQWYGGHPHTFGPRHFLTQRQRTFDYLNGVIPLRRCNDHVFLTFLEGEQDFFNFPIHIDDVQRLKDRDKIQNELANKSETAIMAASNLEEYWIASVGPTLYSKFVDKYTRKMWLVDSNTVFDEFTWSQKGVALKEGNRAAWDIAISAYPYDPAGYNKYFDIATSDPRITLLMKTKIDKFDIQRKAVSFNGEERKYDFIINTISPDLLFGNRYGELPYVGREVVKVVLPIEHAFPENVYFLYYAGDEPFLRIVEYKKFTLHKSKQTLLGIEFPSKNGRYYPYPIKSEQERAQKYYDLMPDGVFSIGRAGSYKYMVDIDDTIEQAMDIAETILTGNTVSNALHYVRQNSKNYIHKI